MNLFADYVQPLTSWLQANPNSALFITFFISLLESLALIGSIVPGSLTMTAVGILAGAGIMRIDLTFIAAILGAICGDSLSYALGYYYSERLADVWPFVKYPNLLQYGKDFFHRHGGKSVLIGRFVGPLRSIIPVIAGIMHMKQWRFLMANVISAIGWSFLYVMPGILIGEVGHELSTESATHFFLLILILLAGIWLASSGIKWLFIKLHYFLKRNLHFFWIKFKNYKLYDLITPTDEKNHSLTAGLLLFILLNLICFILLQTQWLKGINLPIYLFIQSIHTPLLEAFFVTCSQLTSCFTLITLAGICTFWFIYHKQLKMVVYIVSITLTGIFIGLLLAHLTNSPRPQGLLVTLPGSSFPDINLEIATALYGFIIFFVSNKYSLLAHGFRTFLLIVLSLSGFATIYLGDSWFTDILASYSIGIIICLIYCLIFRKVNGVQSKKNQSTKFLFILFLGILCTTMTSTYLSYKNLLHNHTQYHKEFTLNKTTWWNQQKPILPLYHLNRIGKKISLLNIQYAGDLDSLQHSLAEQGWVTHTESFFAKLIMRMNNKPNGIKLPLFAQLHENKKPELIMTYEDIESHLILDLSIWESNYILQGVDKPLWIGTIHQNPSTILTKPVNTLTYLLPALTRFTLRRVKLTENMVNISAFPAVPYILLIKETNSK